MEQSDTDKAEKIIREHLANGPKLLSELLSASGIPARTLQRAALRVKVRRTRDGKSGPWIWHLPAPDGPEHLFSPAPVVEPEYLPSPPAAAALPAKIEELLEVAVQRGMTFPMTIATKARADAEWYVATYSAPDVVLQHVCGVRDDVVHPYHSSVTTVRETEPETYHSVTGSVTLVIERGQPPELRDWTYRRPTTATKKREVKS